MAGCNILLATNCSCRRGWIPQLLQKEKLQFFLVTSRCNATPSDDDFNKLPWRAFIIQHSFNEENIELRQVIVDECGTSPEPEAKDSRNDMSRRQM